MINTCFKIDFSVRALGCPRGSLPVWKLPDRPFEKLPNRFPSLSNFGDFKFYYTLIAIRQTQTKVSKVFPSNGFLRNSIRLCCRRI